MNPGVVVMSIRNESNLNNVVMAPFVQGSILLSLFNLLNVCLSLSLKRMLCRSIDSGTIMEHLHIFKSTLRNSNVTRKDARTFRDSQTSLLPTLHTFIEVKGSSREKLIGGCESNYEKGS